MVAGGVYTAVAFVQRSEVLITERCTAAGGGSAELATDQAANAGLITAVAVRRGLPARAASIALATAMQESKIRNIGHGDQAGPDSRGLFQQRPSQGWGTAEQVMDPYHASNAFYDALVKVPDYQTLEITDAAQRVQRSAYPDAYAQHEVMARSFASSLTGQTAAGLDCRLRDADAAGDPATVQERLTSDFGAVPAATEGGTLVLEAEGDRAWAMAQWAVANAKALSITEVQAEGRSWTRQDRNGWQASEVPAGQVRVTVAGAPAQ
ncbi:hypothetical protein [Arthrobacter sp. AL12]|uniref:hypothetical protein n=1 Tax=Arthrobacter sp. AL12 TaxID=3042241 RepID=UPI00249AFD11|nr:hypothetical protein [Arthrobacter sp. AL12]MDI3213802.1 hypothetical protein [Arthrobacter sp. AL12]